MIYLVEDDASIRELVVYALNNSGFQASGFEAPSAFWQAVSRQTPELILLDIMMPGLSGLEVLSRIRKKGLTVPVLFLTARDSVDDRVMGPDSGANDYLVKPFKDEDLVKLINNK